MAHGYPGIDAPAIPPNPSPRGKWLNSNATDDGDDRDAASAMVLVECAMDRSVWLWWRTFDLISGGTYTWTATITESQHWIRNGINQFRSAGNLLASTAGGGAKLYVGDPTEGDGSIIVTADGSIQWTGAGSAAQWANGATLKMLISAGNATFFNVVDLAGTTNLSGHNNISGTDTTISADTILSGDFTRTGPMTLFGANAYTNRRIATAGDADHAGFEPWKWDIVIISGAGADRAWTFATPPAGFSGSCRFVKNGAFHGSGHLVDLNGDVTLDFTGGGGANGVVEFTWCDDGSGAFTGWIVTDRGSQWTFPITIG